MKNISWGWRIVILYVIFIAGTVSWVGFAMTQEVDLVRPDYYEQGLEHDSIMAAQTRARALGSQAGILYDRPADTLRIRIPNTGGVFLNGSIACYRPNAVDSDRTIPFAPGSNGTMTLPANTFAHGVWRFTLDWNAAGLNYEIVQTDTL